VLCCVVLSCSVSTIVSSEILLLMCCSPSYTLCSRAEQTMITIVATIVIVIVQIINHQLHALTGTGTGNRYSLFSVSSSTAAAQYRTVQYSTVFSSKQHEISEFKAYRQVDIVGR
jgi:hypothetical protein